LGVIRELNRAIRENCDRIREPERTLDFLCSLP
jgi:hypothetical protein